MAREMTMPLIVTYAGREEQCTVEPSLGRHLYWTKRSDVEAHVQFYTALRDQSWAAKLLSLYSAEAESYKVAKSSING